MQHSLTVSQKSGAKPHMTNTRSGRRATRSGWRRSKSLSWRRRKKSGWRAIRRALWSIVKPSARTDGKWLRQHTAVVKVGDTIFLHGGIPLSLTSSTLEQINAQVREEIENFDSLEEDLVARKVILRFFTIREIAAAVQGELQDLAAAEGKPDDEYRNKLAHLLDFNTWLCMRDEGPLWFRGYDAWSDEDGDPQIQKILAAYQAGHIVAAHTVQKTSRIRSRFGGKVFLIDTGMLSAYWAGGRASALDIQGGKFSAQYLDGQEVLVDDKHPASARKVN